MEMNTNASYQFSDRVKGETKLELFNDHYLRVLSCRMKQKRDFKLEVATLNPEAKKIEDMAWHWLVASVLAFGAAIYFVYYLIASADAQDVITLLGSTAGLLLASAGFALAFWISSERKWVFETRAAQYPLVTIPFRKNNRKEAGEFAELLQQAISATTDKKGYSRDDLFAGEMRMLRRLAKSGVISDSLYDSAKKHMLGKSQQMASATVT